MTDNVPLTIKCWWGKEAAFASITYLTLSRAVYNSLPPSPDIITFDAFVSI